MTYKIINLCLIVASIILLCGSIFIHVNAFVNISEPEFENLISARLLGVNNRDFFLELVFQTQNMSNVVYQIRDAELYFFEFERTIANVYLYDTVNINPFTSSIFEVNATLNRDIFERLIADFIDAYSFILIGSIQVKTFFFSRELKVYYNIPINIKELFNNFLGESFKNSISVENISLTEEGSLIFLDCDINVFNRTGFDLNINSFEGIINVNRISDGRCISFEPIGFSSNHPTRSSTLRFRIHDDVLGDAQNLRYIIEGTMTAILWETEFNFPILIIGEN